MKITERRIVEQQWYETELSKTGWDSYGWVFKDSGSNVEVNGWEIVEHLHVDKFGNAWLGIAEKETEINE
jgi:hypothetical protein